MAIYLNFYSNPKVDFLTSRYTLKVNKTQRNYSARARDWFCYS